MFTTLNEWIVLALTLLGGLLIGLALHPGGRKWRDRYSAERDAHAVARRDYESRLTGTEARLREADADRARAAAAEARIAEVERERDARIAEAQRDGDGRRAPLTGDRDDHAGELARGRESLSLAQARIRELERENDRLSQAGRTQPAAAPATSAPVAPVVTTARAEPVPMTRRVAGGSRTSRGWFDWGPGSDPRVRR